MFVANKRMQQIDGNFYLKIDVQSLENDNFLVTTAYYTWEAYQFVPS